VGEAVSEAEGDALGDVGGGVLVVEGTVRSEETVRSKVLSAPVPSGGSALWSSSSAETNVESPITTTTITASTTGARTAVRG
jgi:hypothetical protein